MILNPAIKVLFLGNYLSAHRGTLGPGEILAKHLITVGIDAKLVSTRTNKWIRAVDILWSALTTRRQIISADVFSGNVLKLLPLVSFIVWLRRKPLVLVLHGGQLPEVFSKKPHVNTRVFRRARAIVTPSLFLQHFFEKQGFKINCLPNPVQLHNFPFSAPLPVSIPKLLWIRAFADLYNPILAVDILSELRHTHPNTTLTMIGPDSGSLLQVREYIAQKGLEAAVQIVGPVANENLGAFHHAHSVFLNTTSYESFGSAVLEAAASGIPIVSTRVGNIPLLWENEQEILLADSLDVLDFAKQIRNILENPTIARQRAEHARKKALQFDITHIVPLWQSLFHELLAR